MKLMVAWLEGGEKKQK